MIKAIITLAFLIASSLFIPLAQASIDHLRIGSKSFTESVILGELVSYTVESTGQPSIHRQAMGGTRLLWNALKNGEIDIYPEYTGTITQEIFSTELINNQTDIHTILASHGIRMTRPLGFNNTYAIGMTEARANTLGIKNISDLQDYPKLRFGFSNEFMARGDGWPSLRKRYMLPQQRVNGLEHDLAYRALNDGDIDAIDLYMTDADIQYYKLRVLDDDLAHFPEYHAVLLYRDDLKPKAMEALAALEGTIDHNAMSAMNAEVKIEGKSESRVAAEFLKNATGVSVSYEEESITGRIFRTTKEHIILVVISLSAAILIALPLGIISAHFPRPGQIILSIAGIIQTIPALALLVFMIPFLGIGAPAAIAALFLYSLLPIIRNTYAGLHDIPQSLRESAEALGLPPLLRLTKIDLPLAKRSILAGIKTSAVINVGFATLGAFIAAGGYGESILTGIRLDNIGLILQGAIPAAILALAVQGLFELVERALIPKTLYQ